MTPPAAAARVCYIRMLCEPASAEHALCERGPGGANDADWLAARLAEQGLGAAKYSLVSLDIATAWVVLTLGF